MSSVQDSGLGHGTNGSPQTSIEEQSYPAKEAENEQRGTPPPKYVPSPKHEPGGIGSPNPIRTTAEGQHLLDTGYPHGKQIYNITQDGIIIKFQPDNTPKNGYHSYRVSDPRDIPTAVRRRMLLDGKISRARYTRLRKGKDRKK